MDGAPSTPRSPTSVNQIDFEGVTAAGKRATVAWQRDRQTDRQTEELSLSLSTTLKRR